MKLRGCLLGLLALGVSTPALADVWIDDVGRSMTLQFPGMQPLVLAPAAHSIDDAANLFKAACLSGSFARTSVGAVLTQSGWGFAFVDQMMPFKEPVNVGGFRAADAAVNVSEGSFFNKRPQCNLLFRAAAPHDQATAITALSATLGAAPSNAADAVKKGKPNKRYQPEWVIPAATGGTLTVYARASVSDPAVTHFAVLHKVSK